MKTSAEPDALERLLDAFDESERREALNRLIRAHDPRARSAGTNVNMHFHSFFSYNAENWSPSHIAWNARTAGLYAAGLCDFDVLDGLDEFLDAGGKLGLRATVNLETRAFFHEYADVDINSPGEPGVVYVMGAGFVRVPDAGSPQAEGLTGYRDRARDRNLALIERINARLPDIAIAYGDDVLPLTPRGVATERHIVSAYINKSHEVFQRPEKVAAFWQSILGLELDEMLERMSDRGALEESVRKKLAKRGGLGYQQPSSDTFPALDEFIAWVRSCQAVPMATWLDGTSAGEADGRAMLETMRAKGTAALNIIPDRNWNFDDPEERALKIEKLNRIVAAAEAIDFPVNIGTEMNKAGLPFADDLDGEALAPHKQVFLKGARIMVGHSILLRYAGFSYVGAEAESEFPDPGSRNAFFETIGALPPLTENEARRLEDMGAHKALSWLRDKAQ